MNRFVDAQSTPFGYYGLFTLASVLAVFAGLFALRVWAEAQLVGIASARWTDPLVYALTYAVILAPVIFAGFCAAFKSASKRRDKIADALDG